MYKIGKILLGWFGGQYKDSGLFKTREDAERGIFCDDKLYELFSVMINCMNYFLNTKGRK